MFPTFVGGAVGYIGYDVVRFFEPTVPIHPRDDLKIPEMIFMIPRMLLVFDHRFRKFRLICNAHIRRMLRLDQAYERAAANLEKPRHRLRPAARVATDRGEAATNAPLACQQHDRAGIRING